MNTVLVTGASGFVGSSCLPLLTAQGFEVHAVSSRAAPADSPIGVTWHRVDLLNQGAGDALIALVRPSHLLHLAWYVEPGKLISSPANYEWVTATLELARAFANYGGKRFVGAGSGYEYDWEFGYCTERLTPLRPNTVYGACKHATHLMLHELARETGISLGWGRIFFLYGPREHPRRLAASVVRSLLREEPALCSHGFQIRDYMHVDDVASGLVAILATEITGAVNISSGQPVTIRDLVQTIGRLMARTELVRLGAIPARGNDSPLVIGDNTRLRTELNWRPKYDLKSGLEQTVEWWAAHTNLNELQAV
jgi:nucleoside-diphosphate-sugar epimerase